MLFSFAYEAAGAQNTRHSLRPLDPGDKRPQNSGERREIANAWRAVWHV